MFDVVDPTFIGGILAVSVFVGILVFLALGRFLGRREIRRHGEDNVSSIGSLETAVFALLGLLIAFTFSGALTRFDTRRAQAVDEANAIGTAYLRVDLLPASVQPRMRATFRDYVDARIAMYRALPDIAAAKRELERAQALQSDLWSQGVAALAMPDRQAGAELLVIPAFNSMFDFTTVRAAATQMHPPLIIYVMLVGFALASGLLAGYQSASTKAHHWVHRIGFALLVAFTIYVILDIEYPRLGLVRIDAIDQVIVNVRASMK